MIRPGTLIALIVALVVGGLCGYRVGKIHRPVAERGRAIAPAESAGGARAALAAAPVGAATLPAHRDGDDLEAERRRALEDPQHLRDLLRRYVAARQPDEKGALLAILSGVANAQVLRVARELARSRDPQRRQDGLDLLKAFPLSEPLARQELVDQIAGETDPATLRQLADMLTPSSMPREDAVPVIDRLAALTQHPDAGVRASGVLQLAQWQQGDDVEAMLHRAILDDASEVRRAAMAGVAGSGARSTRLKDALLEIAVNPRSNAADRGAAVFALQSFALDRTDYALYARAAAEIDGDDVH